MIALESCHCAGGQGGGDLDDDEASTSTRARRSHSLTTAGVMDEAGALATALWARTGVRILQAFFMSCLLFSQISPLMVFT